MAEPGTKGGRHLWQGGSSQQTSTLPKLRVSKKGEKNSPAMWERRGNWGLMALTRCRKPEEELPALVRSLVGFFIDQKWSGTCFSSCVKKKMHPVTLQSPRGWF